MYLHDMYSITGHVQFKEDLLTHNKKEADRWLREAFKLEEQLTVSHTNIENLKLENKKLREDLQ